MNLVGTRGDEAGRMKVKKSREPEIFDIELGRDLLAENKRLAKGNKKRFDDYRLGWRILTPVHWRTGVRRGIDQKGPRP